MFIGWVTKVDTVYKTIEQNTLDSDFNIYEDQNLIIVNKPGRKSLIEAINSFVLANTEIINIYNSIKNSVSDIVKASIEPLWIQLTDKINNMTLQSYSKNLDSYKEMVELYINIILMSQIHRIFTPRSNQPIRSIIGYFYAIKERLTREFYEVIETDIEDIKHVYKSVIKSLQSLNFDIIFYQETNPDAGKDFIHFFNNDFNKVQAFIGKISQDKQYQETRAQFIEAFIEKLIDVTNIIPTTINSEAPFVVFLRIVLTAIFFISNYQIKQEHFDSLKTNLSNFIPRLTEVIASPGKYSFDANLNSTLEGQLIVLVNKCCKTLASLESKDKHTLSKAYGVEPVKLAATATGAITPPIASDVFKTTANDKIGIEATFFTLLMFYASYDFSIDALIVEKFKSKFVEKKFEIKPFLLFDSGEFDIIKRIKDKGSDFDPHVFDLEKESLQLFHVGSIGSLWDYANGKLTILLYNMLQNPSYKELLKRKYDSNKLFLFECINALKHFKAHILQPGKSSTITFAMSTLKAIEILLVKLSFILNAFESKFIAADSVIFQVTINGMPANYTINSPYEVTSLTISSGSPSLTPRTAADADAVRLEAEAVAATADAKRLADEARIAAKDVGLETPPLTARGAPEVVGGGTTDLTGHDDTHAYRVATPDYLPLYHKKTENDDHTRQMHTTEIKLPIISTKSSKTQSKERGTKKEPSVRRKKKASSRYTNKIKKILTRVFR